MFIYLCGEITNFNIKNQFQYQKSISRIKNQWQWQKSISKINIKSQWKWQYEIEIDF